MRFYKSPSRLFLLVNLLVIFIIFAIGFRSNIYQKKIDKNDLAHYNGKNISFTGFVCEEADVDYKSRRLTICSAGSKQH